MGCYGVGITRSLAAVIEQHHDDSGIVWPMSVAPLEVAVVPLSVDDDVVWPVAEELWRGLADAGIEVLIDDRDERAGVKFADADLVGYPYQVVVGKRGVAAGVIELKDRSTGERDEVSIGDLVATLASRITAERDRYR
jgi:prolyl-tRNA synthetase